MKPPSFLMKYSKANWMKMHRDAERKQAQEWDWEWEWEIVSIAHILSLRAEMIETTLAK